MARENGPSRTPARVADAASRRWLEELREPGHSRDRATARLHELLLRMAYARLHGLQPPPRGGLLDELANEAADEAVVRVLAHLDDFRGLSLFTTWACQFAVTEVSVTLRRHRRLERELPIEPRLVRLMGATRAGCDDDVERAELLQVLCDGIVHELTPRQRAILRVLAIDGRSPDAVADALGTNAGALYKGLHDARRKLRAHLASHGLTANGETTVAR